MATTTTEDYMVTDATEDMYYSSDYEDEMCDTSSMVEFGRTFTPVFYSIVIFLSLLGNILIIVILAKFEDLKSLTSACILNLAISDLIFTIGLPFWSYYYIYGWTLGEPACKIVSFVFSVGFYSSGILLILMTAHRYIAVMNPLSDIVALTGCYSVLASVVIWAVSILLASPALLFTQVQEQTHCVFADSFWSLWGIYQQNCLFVVSLCVFIFCYSHVIKRLLNPIGQRRKHKTLKLIFTLMVVFFVGWTPYNVVIFLQSTHFWPKEELDSKALVVICEQYKPLEYAFYISRVIAFSHCCINPVFYVFVGIKFKNNIKKMLQRCSHNKSSIKSRHSRVTITSITSGEEFSS